MKDWLKGGLIGLIISIMIILILGLVWFQGIFHFPFRILVFLFIIISLFILGSITGWIIGKIKSERIKKRGLPGRYSKLAILSFIISLVSVIIDSFFALKRIINRGLDILPLENLEDHFILAISSFAPMLLILALLSFILGIVSLFVINKYNLKGRIYAWLAIVISLIMVLVFGVASIPI